LYARVSTDKQEREETVASQVDLLRQTAEARGYEVLPGNIFIDDGVSGTRLDRPALERLRDLVAEGAFEVVLVTAPDRLARRYAYQVVLVEELTRCGCEVVFVHQSLGASPEEQMLLQMQGVFAEYERALIHERTRRGQLFAARQGRVNWGNPPYGYTYIHKTATTPQHLVVNETEAEVVRQIYRWCVEEQMSSYAIHRRLTVQGIPPRKSKYGRWAQSSVIEILRDSVYKGEAYYNRTQPGDVRRPYGLRGLKDRHPGNGQSRTRRPQTEWVPVRVPALIDPQTWDRAQGQLARNRERAQRNNTQQSHATSIPYNRLWRDLQRFQRAGLVGLLDHRTLPHTRGKSPIEVRIPLHVQHQIVRLALAHPFTAHANPAMTSVTSVHQGAFGDSDVPQVTPL
jgi:site-specific DNA recombinase